MHIRLQSPGDAPAIDALLDAAFGPARHMRTAQRLRDGNQPVAALSLAAEDAQGRIAGAISFWPLALQDPLGGGSTPALLLGPLVVAASAQNSGLGSALINAGLTRAQRLGAGIELLIGDAPYDGRFGFSSAHTGGWVMPGPVDPQRLLARTLDAAITPGTGWPGVAMVIAASTGASAPLQPPAEPQRSGKQAPAEQRRQQRRAGSPHQRAAAILHQAEPAAAGSC